jgi:DNA-binding NarL/FixJ family response regulator
MKNNDIPIVIADDHPLLLDGLYKELTANDFNVVGKAADGKLALGLILAHQPAIALLDIDMPLLTGFDVIKKAKEKGVETKFILLSYHKEVDYVTKAKALQIHGYLLKEDSFLEIKRCIEHVLKGETYFSPSFDNISLQSANEELQKIQFLTPSEKTILKFIADQMSNAEIAETLSVSIRTVEKHRSNIIAKLDIEGGTNALTNWALLHSKMIIDL